MQCAIVRSGAGFYHAHQPALTRAAIPQETRMYLTQSLHRAVQQHPQRIATRCGKVPSLNGGCPLSRK